MIDRGNKGWLATAVIAMGCVAPLSLAGRPGEGDAALRQGNALLAQGLATEAVAAYGTPADDEPARLRLARAMAQIAASRDAAESGPTDTTAPAPHNLRAQGEATLRDLAEGSSDDVAMLSTARAALGAALIERATVAETSDPQAAIELYRDAAGQYLAACRLDPSDIDAARNVEHARQRLAELRQRLEQARNEQASPQSSPQGQDGPEGQQQEQQPQEGDSTQSPGERAREVADAVNDLAQRQQQEGERSSQNRQDRDGGERQQDLSDQTAEQVEALERMLESMEGQREGETTQPEPEGSPPAGDPSPEELMQQAREALEQARERQGEAQQALDEGDQREAGELQSEAASRLAEASERLQQAAEGLDGNANPDQGERDQPEGEQDGQSQRQAEAHPAGDADQPREAQARQGDPLVDRLLDRERRQRELRAVSRPGRPVRVERDW